MKNSTTISKNILNSGVAFYIKHVMKNDELEQARRVEQKKQKPRFKVQGPAVTVGVVKTESQDSTQSSQAELT